MIFPIGSHRCCHKCVRLSLDTFCIYCNFLYFVFVGLVRRCITAVVSHLWPVLLLPILYGRKYMDNCSHSTFTSNRHTKATTSDQTVNFLQKGFILVLIFCSTSFLSILDVPTDIKIWRAFQLLLGSMSAPQFWVSFAGFRIYK